jgi:hypothetical protein
MVIFLKQNYTDGQELQHPQAKLPLLLYHLHHGEMLLFALRNKLQVLMFKRLLVLVLKLVTTNVMHVTVLPLETVLLLNSK